MKFEPPDIMGFPPNILPLPGDEHLRSESIYGAASRSQALSSPRANGGRQSGTETILMELL